MRHLAQRSIDTPRPHRTWLQRFLVAFTLGDSGRNMAEVEGCWHLHRIADLEREVYGEIVSSSARDHVEGTPEERAAKGQILSAGCRLHWMTVHYS